MTPIEQVEQSLDLNDGIAAEAQLNAMLTSGTKASDLAAYLGEAKLLQNDLIEARKWLEGRNFSPETRSYGFHMLARLELRSNNLPAAGAAFDEVLKIGPGSAELWVDIGRMRYGGGEQSQAVEASIYAVKLEPDNVEALLFRAQLVRNSEGMRASLPWFERALEYAPDDPDLLLDYAATLGEVGRAHDMLAIIRKAAQLAPDNKRIFFLQAVLAARAGNFDLAGLLLFRTNAADREQPAAMLLSGIIDIKRNNYSSASLTLGRLAAQQPENQRVRQLHALALSLGQSDRELTYLYGEKALQPSASPYLRTLVARSYEALNNREKAGEILDLAAQPMHGNLVAILSDSRLDVAEARGPLTGSSTLELIRARINAGQAEGARAAAEQLLAQFSGSADVQALAGDANLAAGNYRSAADQYRRSGSIRKPWLITRKLLTALHAANRPNEALIVLAQHFVSDIGNVEAAVLLAREAYIREDYGSAAIFADHALVNGGHRDPVLRAMRAEIAMRLGDMERAILEAERGYALQKMSYVTTSILAAVYREAGDRASMVAALERKAAKLAP